MSRPVLAGVAAAVGLATVYSLVIGLASGSWSHLTERWRADVVFLVPVAAGFGIQVGLYLHVRRLVRGGGQAVALAAGSTTSSTAAMVACCLHHLSDVLPLVGLAGAAAFVVQYRLPVIAVSLGASATGIALMVRMLRRVQSAGARCH